jgi:predicted permease
MPPSIPRIDEIRVDGSVLAMTLALSLLVALLASVIPAATASGRALAEALRQARGPAASHRGTGRRVLVVAQFALTLVLAHGAALMLRSYWTLRSTDTGFSTEDVLTMRLDVSGPRYEQPEHVGAFFDETVRRVESLPGVTRAAAINRLPLEGGRNNTATIEGRDPTLGRFPTVETRVITPGYFDAMGIRLLSSRTLTEFDGAPSSLPAAVINQAMARLGWPDESPIGKRFRFGDELPWMTIVGVVADTRQWGIEWPARPEAYQVHGASPFQSELRFLVVRTATDPMSLVGAVRREIGRIDQDQPLADIRTMADVVDSAIAERRFGTMLVGLFASTALLLVVAAIYALMSFFVAQRTPEIGVRMAFGATRGDVLRLILSNALTLTGIGAAIGLAGVVATAGLARGLVYGISPSDPGMVAGVTALLVVIALAGSLVPAWRATRVDPVQALRAE